MTTTFPAMLARVFVRGGILSPGDLLKVIEVARQLGADYVHLGSRQDILFPVHTHDKAAFALLETLPLPYDYGEKRYQNIVSSYVTLDVVATTRWLAPHIYHYVLDSFDYLPTHKINVTDPLQGMVPLFTGNINFVASPVDNYWYLYLRYSEVDPHPWCCPDLVYGFDLAKVAKGIEALDPVRHPRPYAELYRSLRDQVSFNTRALEQPLHYPEMMFPYYEGMNRIEENKYWMGLYWRNNQFTNKFLRTLSERCLETQVGVISLTPWKSLIVKGITEKARTGWEKLLGRHGINLRHSSLELNWHLPVADAEALTLKNYLVRALDQQDISTYGLTFSVKTQAHKILFASIVIERAGRDDEQQPYLYNILYAKDFNPNLLEYLYYTRGVTQEIIPSILIELSKKYYEQLDARKSSPPPEEPARTSEKVVYQCPQCYTIYDPAVGDPLAEVMAETPWSKVPSTYRCSVCDEPKESFAEIVWP